MFGPGRGASANPPKFGKFRGQTGRKADGRGIVSPRTFQARRGAFFALFAGSGSPRRIGGGEGAASPTAKKPNRTAAHNSHSAPSSRRAGSPPPAFAWSGCLTGRPPVRSRAPLGRAARVILWCYISAITSGAGGIPRMPWQGRGASSPAQRDRESVFQSARPHSAGFGRIRRAGRARGRRRDSPPMRRRDIFRCQLLAENIVKPPLFLTAAP